MSTAAPENSIQTLQRYAWTGAKVAYGLGVVGHIFSSTEHEPLNPEGIEVDAALADIEYKRLMTYDFVDLRSAITEALEIKLGDKNYLESAEAICAALEVMASRSPVDGLPIEPDRRAACKKVQGWAAEMLPVWIKIRAIRKHQTKIIQDDYLTKMGVKSEFDVWYENISIYVDRWTKYLFRFLIYWVIFMVIWCIIDHESLQAFDNSLPDYKSSFGVVEIMRWLGFKVD